MFWILKSKWVSKFLSVDKTFSNLHVRQTLDYNFGFIQYAYNKNKIFVCLTFTFSRDEEMKEHKYNLVWLVWSENFLSLI